MHRAIWALKTVQKLSVQRRTLHTVSELHIGGVVEVL